MSCDVEYGFRAHELATPPPLDPAETARRRVLIALEDILQFDADREFRALARARYLALTAPAPANDGMQQVNSAAVVKKAAIVMVHENMNIPDRER